MDGEGTGRSGSRDGKSKCVPEEKKRNKDNNTIINTMMLKFRPIAPKPASGSGGSSTGSAEDASKNNSIIGLVKRKRKYVRVARRNNICATRNSKEKEKGQKQEEATLANNIILSESQQAAATSFILSDQKTSESTRSEQTHMFHEFLPERSGDSSSKTDVVLTDDDPKVWNMEKGTARYHHHEEEPRARRSTGNGRSGSSATHNLPSTATNMINEQQHQKQLQRGEVVMVKSWVTVERLTDTCVDLVGKGLGCTDFQRKKNLERDTCPAFISDAMNKVPWTNLAYRRLIMGHKFLYNHDENIQLYRGHHEYQINPYWAAAPGETPVDRKDDDVVAIMVVSLLERERLPIMYPAFACLVRLQYYNYIINNQMNHHNDNNKNHNSSSSRVLTTMTVPCDVWRMDQGGFAWRLDVKAALTL